MSHTAFLACIAHLDSALESLAQAARLTEDGTTDRHSLQIRTLTWKLHAFVGTIRDNCDVPAICNYRKANE